MSLLSGLKFVGKKGKASEGSSIATKPTLNAAPLLSGVTKQQQQGDTFDWLCSKAEDNKAAEPEAPPPPTQQERSYGLSGAAGELHECLKCELDHLQANALII
jgi:hypothetical protein